MLIALLWPTTESVDGVSSSRRADLRSAICVCASPRMVMQRSASLGNLSSFVDDNEYLSLVNECERSPREALGYPITSPPFVPETLAHSALSPQRIASHSSTFFHGRLGGTAHLKFKFKFAIRHYEIHFAVKFPIIFGRKWENFSRD